MSGEDMPVANGVFSKEASSAVNDAVSGSEIPAATGGLGAALDPTTMSVGNDVSVAARPLEGPRTVGTSFPVKLVAGEDHRTLIITTNAVYFDGGVEDFLPLFIYSCLEGKSGESALPETLRDALLLWSVGRCMGMPCAPYNLVNVDLIRKGRDRAMRAVIGVPVGTKASRYVQDTICKGTISFSPSALNMMERVAVEAPGLENLVFSTEHDPCPPTRKTVPIRVLDDRRIVLV